MTDGLCPVEVALILAIQHNLADPLPCFALADHLEEQGRLSLAFAARWMGWHGKRPGFRQGERLRRRWVWYREATGNLFTYLKDEQERYRALPHARLDFLIFAAMRRPHHDMVVFDSWPDAFNALATGLQRLHDVREPPRKP